MRSWEANFLDFCKGMWFENCVERRGYGDDLHDFDVYFDLNKEWLKKQHAEYKIKKARRTDAWT